MKKIKMIIFDLDDTIVNTYNTEFKKAKRAAYNAYRIRITRKQFNSFYGIPNFNLQMSKMLNRNNIDDFLQYFDYLSKIIKYKQIVSIRKIEKLKKQGIIIGIITNSKESKTNKKISDKLKSKLDFIFSVEDLEKAKPDPNILRRVMRNYKIKPKECVCVGDSKTDYYFALNGNVKFYKVNTGLNKEKLDVLNFRNVNKFICFFMKERRKNE
jgi:HAD hydrolase, family IA, variant 1